MKKNGVITVEWNKVLSEKYPVRRTQEQKQAFLMFVTQELEKMGYSVKLENTPVLKNKNLIAGDPDHCRIMLFSNYDTPAHKILPDLRFPGNPFIDMLYQVLNAFLLLMIALAVYLVFNLVSGRTSAVFFLAVYAFLLFLQIEGFPNQPNRNAQSGLAVLLTVMERLSPEARSSVCFALFDHGEMGHCGAKSFCKSHLQTQYTRLSVEFGPMGVGNELLLVTQKLARKATGYHRVVESLLQCKDFAFQELPVMFSACRSGFRSFSCGMLLMCAKKNTAGFFLPHLHTKHDNYVDEKQMDILADVIAGTLEAKKSHDKPDDTDGQKKT